MLYHYQFQVHYNSSLENALEEAARLGIHDIYTLELPGSGSFEVCGFAQKGLVLSSYHLILKSATPSEISWEEQSLQFSPYYKDGLVSIPLSEFCSQASILKIKPGPGFGDLSHPTTYLTLKLMAPYMPNRAVIDLGCGSGILSFASALMNASSVLGIDIDPEAIAHAEKNRGLNQVATPIQFAIEFPCNYLFKGEKALLMNMTLLEQKIAWQCIVRNVSDFSFILTSGLLAEQEEEYLQWAKTNGWTLERKQQKDGWLGFVFKQS